MIKDFHKDHYLNINVIQLLFLQFITGVCILFARRNITFP